VSINCKEENIRVKNLSVVVVIVAVFLHGCAGVEVTRITKENPYKEGIRFYRPYPYLLITKVKQGENLECKIVYLPNVNEEYAVRVKSGIGSTEAKLTLEDGWNLTQFGETRESKSAEMVNALTGSLAGLKQFLKMNQENELLPGLYALIFDEKTGLVSGVKPVFQLQ
jgi:hypothetical protein